MAYRSPMTVRFGDVDRAGIVYYPRLLHYCHVAKEELFAEVLEVDYAEVTGRQGFGLPTVHLEADFHHPLRYGDRLEIEVRVDTVGRTSIGWRFVLYRVGREAPVAEVRTVTVGVDLERFRKAALPGWLRDRLAAGPAASAGSP